MSQVLDALSRRILVGPLGREMARFGTPLALGMGLQTAFNLVDAYLIGHLGTEIAGPALGAIGICDQLAALGTIVSYGLTVATGAMLSHRQGRGDHAGVRQVAW
jgi:Na+-driven multidrug efflux pump